MSDIPKNFDAYWANMQAELAALPIAPELTEMPIRSNEHGTVYALKYTSLGAYRIFAYYCVPHGKGPFPCIVHMPRYGSVNNIPAFEVRQRYVSLQICHRGQRLSDSPYAAAYPGLLTDGIDDPQRYIFRGIVADCLRGMDVIYTRAEVDQAHISITGNDLALITAALRPNCDSIIVHPELFHNTAELITLTSGYPLEEINDYVRAYPERTAQVRDTLDYYDTLHFAPRVTATTLLVTGASNDFYSPARCDALAAALGGPVERRISEHSSYRDGAAEATWLAHRHGFAQPILPAHWR